ncbi:MULTISPECIES: hypothetical protein [unclassified Campylobacter]|uniref:hypothetical protein n=1 Tax=unclassified Campylobacter TaxID=2593542 RepID=UPI003D33F045
MILAFEFKCFDNHEILAHMLKFHAKNFKNSIVIKDDSVTLFVSGDEQDILAFSDILGKNLSFSIFVTDSKVFVTEIFVQNSTLSNDVFCPNLTPMQVEKYHETHSLVKNEFETKSQISVFGKQVDEMNFNELLDRVCNFLTQGKDVVLTWQGKDFKLSLLDTLASFDFIIPTNLSFLNNIFECNDTALKALASLEKPLIKLKTNAIFRQNHKDEPTFSHIKAPSDIFTYAVCEKLAKNAVKFIGVKNTQAVNLQKVILLENGFLAASSKKYLPTGDHFMIRLNKNGDDGIFFSRKNENISLLLAPSFSSFDEILNLENGQKLLKNFKANFKLTNISQNSGFYTLFSIVAALLKQKKETKDCAQNLFDLAFDFGANRGVLIECKRDKLKFENAKFIRSAMSFMLAGATDKNIAYGAISSLAGFLNDLLLECDLVSKDVLLCGDVFDDEIVAKIFHREISNFNIFFENKVFLEQK